MIELLKQQFTPAMSNEEKINQTREFLQILALKIMYDKKYLNNLAFVGGTALRLLFNLRRFSEDLDFSLINKGGYNFIKINSQLEQELKLYGLNVETKVKLDRTVNNTFKKFSGLLKNLGLSSLDEQKLSIKIEVDANPPNGWNTETTLINKIYIINLVHFDLPSLYASKLHACFFRKYIKGRDYYDLVWYIGKKIKPNYMLLNNAIKQTEGYDLKLNSQNFNDFLLSKLAKINFTKIKKDVERFLEDRTELKFLEFDIIKRTLTTYNK
jgi:predicted nucleotidyltransferase component of viral defense system